LKILLKSNIWPELDFGPILEKQILSEAGFGDELRTLVHSYLLLTVYVPSIGDGMQYIACIETGT